MAQTISVLGEAWRKSVDATGRDVSMPAISRAISTPKQHNEPEEEEDSDFEIVETIFPPNGRVQRTPAQITL